ncbi:response regulator receiver domain [Brevibacillus sp. HD3.3A]|uniref:response regulator receiver domain n=1 Tax=Brevibacillus sp. HD3.3A TaxID=2738979 RepID=UPI00156B9896|nr:response regulator receiver domain [Brevibacillus sp. HD3.3A]UED69447.1 hypothetical protein HP435_01860 [Brevibacillus sp. HD3.3A]
MNEIQQVESIVKGYFDNAIIIDDEMNLYVEKVHKLSNDDLGELPDDIDEEDTVNEETRIEVAAGIEPTEDDLSNRPLKLLRQLTTDGFITYPYKFNDDDTETQIEFLSKILRTSKLLFIDWNLEGYLPESPERPGKAALEIIKTYSNHTNGLKCVVIYTQEDSTTVLEQLTNDFELIDEENFFFQERDGGDGNSLFGFVMRKSVEPQEIITKISSILLKDKCIPLHVMDSASRLEKSIANVIYKFNAPFEKVLLTQMLSLDIKNDGIPKFLDETLLSNILSDELPLDPKNFLFSAKREKIREKMQSNQITYEIIKHLCDTFNFKGKDSIADLFKKQSFLTGLKEIFSDVNVRSFEHLNNRISEILDSSMSKKINDIILMTVLAVYFIEETDKEFKTSFLTQTYYFTKLLKYIDTSHDRINTGSIFKMSVPRLARNTRNKRYVKNTNKRYDYKYLLCITPFCDTHRPSVKVDNNFKFIVGTIVEPESTYLKNMGENYACIAVPFDREKTIKFIKWDFYNVVSYRYDEVMSRCEKIATLKRSYIQNIINKYISYQSRAGVNELFFKETYRDTFVNFLK